MTFEATDSTPPVTKIDFSESVIVRKVLTVVRIFGRGCGGLRPSIIAGKARLLPPGWQHIQKDGRLNLSSSCHPIFRLDWPPNSRSVSNASLAPLLRTDYISFKCCHRLPNRALRSGLGFPVVRSFEIGEGLPLPAHQLAPHKPGNGLSWCS